MPLWATDRSSWAEGWECRVHFWNIACSSDFSWEEVTVQCPLAWMRPLTRSTGTLVSAALKKHWDFMCRFDHFFHFPEVANRRKMGIKGGINPHRMLWMPKYVCEKVLQTIIRRISDWGLRCWSLTNLWAQTFINVVDGVNWWATNINQVEV